MGAVAVQEANRSRSANRATSPTTANPGGDHGPTPPKSIRWGPWAATIAFNSAVAFFIFARPGSSPANCAWSRSTVWTRRRVSASRPSGRSPTSFDCV